MDKSIRISEQAWLTLKQRALDHRTSVKTELERLVLPTSTLEHPQNTRNLSHRELAYSPEHE